MKTAEEIALAYKSPPWWYDLRGLIILELTYRIDLFALVSFFGRNFGKVHLEVAVGSGSFLKLILLWRQLMGLPKCTIVGVDYAETMLSGAIWYFAKHKNMSFVHADVANMDFADGYFDTINVANAVHCFPEVDAALQGIYRVLKPGGTAAVNVLLYPRSGGFICEGISKKVNAWGAQKGILVTPYESDDIRNRFLKIGFKILSEKVVGNCYNVILNK